MSDRGPPKQAHRYQKQADSLIPTFEKVDNWIPFFVFNPPMAGKKRRHITGTISVDWRGCASPKNGIVVVWEKRVS